MKWKSRIDWAFDSATTRGLVANGLEPRIAWFAETEWERAKSLGMHRWGGPYSRRKVRPVRLDDYSGPEHAGEVLARDFVAFMVAVDRGFQRLAKRSRGVIDPVFTMTPPRVLNGSDASLLWITYGRFSGQLLNAAGVATGKLGQVGEFKLKTR